MNKIVLTSLLTIISSVSFTFAASFTLSKAVTPTADGLSAKITVKASGVTTPTTLTLKVEGVGATTNSNFTSPGVDGFYLLPIASGDSTKEFTVGLLSSKTTTSNEEVKVSIIDVDGLVQESPVSINVSIKEVPLGTTTGAGPVTTTVSPTIQVAVDKVSAGRNEMFKVTVTGLPSRYFTTGDLLRFTRDSAPSTQSCITNKSALCFNVNEIACGILPQYMGVNAAQWYADTTGKIEYICYANSVGTSTVTSVDQVYNVKVLAPVLTPNSNGAFPAPVNSVNTASITLKANGVKGTMTNYNNCTEGKGLNPYEIYRGCTDCQYVPEGWRSNILTCQNTPEIIYKWYARPRGSIFEYYSACGAPKIVGSVCSKGTPPCETGGGKSDPNAVMYHCTPNGGVSFAVSSGLYGLVVDINGKPVAGVDVTVPWVGFGMSWKGTTDVNGKYVIENVEPAGVGWIAFKKAGYIDDGMLARLGENNTFVMRPTPAIGQLEVCPIGVFRSTLGNNPCNCPSNTTKEPMSGGFICNLTSPTVSTSNTTAPLSMSPSYGSFDPVAKNTITFTLANADPSDLQACYAVLAHPTSPASVNATYCTTGNNFVDFTGNADWKFQGGNLVGTFTYDAGTWGTGGVKTVSYFRKKSSPSNVVSATIEVLVPTNNSSNVVSKSTSAPLGEGVVSGIVDWLGGLFGNEPIGVPLPNPTPNPEESCNFRCWIGF